MLEFFRKYQKSFFLVIAVVVISSFVFFGTFNAVSGQPKRADRVIGTAIDGSKVHLIELQNLSRFLSVDREDLGKAERHAFPNLLNDGVIRRDLLLSGVAEVLARQNWDLLEREMGEKLNRIKAYRGYEHPQAPFISAQSIWERFSPAVNREWSETKSMPEAGPELFGHLAKLYSMQDAMPAEFARRILMMTEQQYKWIQPDPRLKTEDLSLFGFHTLSDWFGRDFVDLAALFIHNTAIAAEEKGYVVTDGEARADLKQNYLDSMRKIQESKAPFQLSYGEQLRILGMDDSEAIHVWKKVLLFRRYMNDIGEAVFVDRLPYSEFAAVASEKAAIDLYQWPACLHFATALDALAFQTYVNSVSAGDPNALSLPKSYLPVEEVEKRTPELTATLYTAQIAAVDKRETALSAPLKEVWQYETREDVWKTLGKEFSFIQNLTAQTEDERFRALESLDAANRAKVDLFARRKLLNAHPEWIDAALAKAELKETKLTLSAGEIRMQHVENGKRLGSLFEQILAKPDEALSELQHFESGEAVFRFENIAKVSDRMIKTFEEAKSDGSLERLVNRALESNFAKLKAKLPADKQSQKWSDVKEDLAELMLASIKKGLLKVAPHEEISFPSLRLLPAATEALASLKGGSTEWIRQEGEDRLSAQFKLQKSEKQIPRSTQEDWMTKEPFVLMPKQWSDIHVSPNGSVEFMYVKDRSVSQEPILERLALGKELLVRDAQKFLAESLIQTMKDKQAIHIPIPTEQE